MYPGSYAILSPNDKISDIINRAGGIKPEAYLEGSMFKRYGQEINISLKRLLLGKNQSRIL